MLSAISWSAVLLGSRGKQCLPLCRLSPNLDTYHHEVAPLDIPLGEVSWESCSVSAYGDPLMSCIPLPKEAVKPVWANQLTQLSCLVVYVKFQVPKPSLD